MGFFGGDKKKKKDEKAEPQDKDSAKPLTARRSRRIVTPGRPDDPPKATGRPGESKQAGAANVRVSPPSQRPASAPALAATPQRPAVRVSSETIIKAPQQPPPAPAPKPALPPVPPPSQPRQAPPQVHVQLRSAKPSAPQPSAPSQPASTDKGVPDLEYGGDIRQAKSGPGRTGDGPLLDFLVNKAGLLTSDQASAAKQKGLAEDLPLDVACSVLGFITEDQLVNALTQECWVPHLKVDKYEIRKKALDTIGEQDARTFGVLPVDKLGSILNLAMVNPLDVEAIRILEGKTGLDIKKVVATRSEIQQGITKYYGGVAAAKEGSLGIAQDHESRRVTQMLSHMEPMVGQRPSARPSAVPPHTPAGPRSAPAASARPTPPPPRAKVDTANVIPEVVEDIDDLLSSGDQVAPAIVEAITLDASEIEPEIEPEVMPELEPLSAQDELEPAITAARGPDTGTTTMPQTSLIEEESALEPVARGDRGKGEALDAIVTPREAMPALPAMQPAPAVHPAPKIEPAPVRPAAGKAPAKEAAPAIPGRKPAVPKRVAFVDLIPVMEEEFQHAITHGRSRVFEKWVSIQTRNRILNAVPVESEIEPLLAALNAHGVQVKV